jgi:hypothetical protein
MGLIDSVDSIRFIHFNFPREEVFRAKPDRSDDVPTSLTLNLLLAFCAVVVYHLQSTISQLLPFKVALQHSTA